MRNYLLLFVLALCYTTTVIAQGTSLDKIEATYFVSSSQGDDGNDGLTVRSPKQHISSIGVKKNARIRLKRGDVFFEQMIGYDNCVIDDYGHGNKPVLCGFKVLMNPQAWTYDEQEKLWKLDMLEEKNFAGCLHGNVADDRINNFGFIYDPNSDIVYGRRVREKKELTGNGRFYLTDQFVPDSIKDETFKWLRWKYDGDPRRIKHLCFPMWLIGMRKLNNCEVRNIAIVGFNFGVVGCNGTTVDNCQIDLIGGSVQLGYQYWVRYGNGVEYSWGNHDNLVTNCLISRTYDCGATIQSSGNFRGSPKNIHFKRNLFYHCRQAFEFFLNAKNDFKPQYENCSFTDNVCYEMGENEFSTPQLRDANLLSYDGTVKSISIEGNTFYGSPYFCGAVFPKGLGGNTVYIYEGQYLHNYHGKRTLPIVLANGEEEIEIYRKQSGDNSTISILIPQSRLAKQTKKKIRKKVGWKPVNLRLEKLKH